MTYKPRNVMLYLHKRDEMAYYFAQWLKTGAIPTNRSLEAQIEATTAKSVDFVWKGNKRQLQQVIPNDELRKPTSLGCSPDERNACECAVLDIDGSEALQQAPANDPPATTSSTPAAKAPEPANDVFEHDFDEMGIGDRLDAFTRIAWGQS